MFKTKNIKKEFSFGGDINEIPLELRRILESENFEIIHALKIEEAKNNVDEKWEIVQGRMVYYVLQDYMDNQGDPISVKEFNTLNQAMSNFNSLEEPEEWRTKYSEHFAFIQEVHEKRKVIYYKYDDDWYLQDETEWIADDNKEPTDLGINKSFGTREADSEQLEHVACLRLRKDIAGQYKVNDRYFIVTEGGSGKYGRVGVQDIDGRDIGNIEIRISDHSYNPDNNVSKGYDGFISVVIANKDETKEKFRGLYNLYFNGDDEYADLLMGVKDRIQEILDVMNNKKFAFGGETIEMNEVQRKLIDSPAFKAWFGDWEKAKVTGDYTYVSKVIDDDGMPLVVYRGEHGKSKPGKLHSRLGSFSFGNSAAAKLYSEDPNDKKRDTAVVAPRVIPVFLKIVKPVINQKEDPFIEYTVIADILGDDVARKLAIKFTSYITYTNNWEENFSDDYKDVEELLEKKPEAVRELYMDAFPLFDDRKVVELFMEKGYDGVIHGGNGETALETEYKIFSQSHAKLADGSNTEFSESPDIRYAKGGMEKKKLLAVNGKPSRLNDIQHKLVRTDAFKKWFGDWEKAFKTGDYKGVSKVIDDNGEPRVVYHGTATHGFEEFEHNTSYFANDRRNAEIYRNASASAIVKPSDFYKQNHAPGVYEVFLNIKKPYDTKQSKILADYENNYRYKYSVSGITVTDRGYPDWTEGENLAEYISETGKDYDGLMVDEGIRPLEDGTEWDRGISWVIFNSNQAKLADGTNKTFNIKSANIMLEKGGILPLGENLTIHDSYTRVIPRDLFNESKLLKCIGRLVLLIHDGMGLNNMEFEHDAEPFDIVQISDGSLAVTNISFKINDTPLLFKSTYNEKSNWPLYLYYDDTEYQVFNDKGEYTEEFTEICNEIADQQFADGGTVENIDETVKTINMDHTYDPALIEAAIDNDVDISPFVHIDDANKRTLINSEIEAKVNGLTMEEAINQAGMEAQLEALQDRKLQGEDGFNFEEELNKLGDAAKDKLRKDIEVSLDSDLEDPVSHFVLNNKLYELKELPSLPFITVGYKELENEVLAKGGKLKSDTWTFSKHSIDPEFTEKEQENMRKIVFKLRSVLTNDGNTFSSGGGVEHAVIRMKDNRWLIFSNIDGEVLVTKEKYKDFDTFYKAFWSDDFGTLSTTGGADGEFDHVDAIVDQVLNNKLTSTGGEEDFAKGGKAAVSEEDKRIMQKLGGIYEKEVGYDLYIDWNEADGTVSVDKMLSMMMEYEQAAKSDVFSRLDFVKKLIRDRGVEFAEGGVANEKSAAEGPRSRFVATAKETAELAQLYHEMHNKPADMPGDDVDRLLEKYGILLQYRPWTSVDVYKGLDSRVRTAFFLDLRDLIAAELTKRISNNEEFTLYEYSSKAGKKSWFIDAYKNAHSGKLNLNVYEKMGNAEQPIHYGNGRVGWEFPERFPNQVRAMVAWIYELFDSNRFEAGGMAHMEDLIIDQGLDTTEKQGLVIDGIYAKGGELEKIKGVAAAAGGKSLVVVCRSVGNPDFRQSPHQEISDMALYPVTTLREASEKCQEYIREWDLGGGNWTGGQVYDVEGNIVARISYNGRIWKNLDDRIEYSDDEAAKPYYSDEKEKKTEKTAFTDLPIGSNVTVDATRMSFAGKPTSTVKKFAQKVRDHVNKIGELESQTSGTATIKFGKTKLTVPKNWVVVVDKMEDGGKPVVFARSIYAKGGKPAKKKKVKLEYWVEENAEAIINHYLPGLDPREWQDRSYESFEDIGDYKIDKDKDAEGNKVVWLEVYFGDKFEEAEDKLKTGYDKFAAFAKELAESSYLGFEILSNDDHQTISFTFTQYTGDNKYNDDEDDNEDYAKGGRTYKETYKPSDLPKDGSAINIHMPALGDFPAKDVVLKYDASNYKFDIYEDGKKVGSTGEKEVLNNLNNGFYEITKSNLTNYPKGQPGTTRHASQIKGLYFITSKVASYRYLTIIHEKSGKPIVKFDDGPIAKVTDVIKIADKILGDVDWDVPESKITEKHHEAVLELKKHVVKDDGGKYYVKSK